MSRLVKAIVIFCLLFNLIMFVKTYFSDQSNIYTIEKSQKAESASMMQKRQIVDEGV